MLNALLLYAAALIIGLLPVWLPVPGFLIPLSLLILLIGSITLWRIEKGSPADLGLRRGPHWGLVIAISLLAGIIVPALFRLSFPLFGPVEYGSADLVSNGDLLAAALPGTLRVLAVALVEELIFRGYFLQRLRREWDDLPALAVSSLLFGIFHLPALLTSGLNIPQLILAILSLSLVGVAFGYGSVYGKNKFCFSGGMHAGYNLSSTLFIITISLLNGAPRIPAYPASLWTGHPDWIPESGLLGIISAGALLGAGWVIVKTTNSD